MPIINADGPIGINGGTGFDFTIIASKGMDGVAAICSWWDDECALQGQTGGPGVGGGTGGPGGPGGHGGTIDIEVDSFSTLIELSAKGGSGGNGGKGGKGQDGGKGGKGGDGSDCELGRFGGSGGPGGNGGTGGLGGSGGNGGTIVVRTRNIADGGQSLISINEGAGGRGGDPGAPGLPGEPGDNGSTTGAYSTSSDCLTKGIVPNFGAPGNNPSNPTLGNGSSGEPGISQFEQIS